MKNWKWILVVGIASAVSVPVVMLRTSSDPLLVTVAKDSNQAAEPEAIDQPAAASTVCVAESAATVALSASDTPAPMANISSKSADTMRVRADRVLATVNRQPILLRHLVALPEDEQEIAMTPDEYQSRLSRAIEMELTFQAAMAHGVDLTPEQKRRVDGVLQKHQAALRDYQKQGITWSSVTTAQVEFEKRLTTALLLQQNLVAREAGVAPSLNAGIQARYEQARSELLGRLKANGEVVTSAKKI